MKNEFIKRFFEENYANGVKQHEDVFRLPDIHEDMIADGEDTDEEWKRWKLVESTITDEQLNELEDKIGTKLPQILRDFLSTYFHYFEDPIGRNSIETPFEGFLNAYNPLLVAAGYVPFSWDEEMYYINCIKLSDERIYNIDHEELFNIDYDESGYEIEDDMDEEEILEMKQELEECIREVHKNMNYVSEGFVEFLNGIKLKGIRE